MEVPAAAPATVPAPKQQPSLFQLAWPRPAQTALAFFLGAILALLAIHAYSYTRWGTRPTELERGVGITYRVDLNHATRAELLQLPGIGESQARRGKSRTCSSMWSFCKPAASSRTNLVGHIVKGAQTDDFRANRVRLTEEL